MTREHITKLICHCNEQKSGQQLGFFLTANSSLGPLLPIGCFGVLSQQQTCGILWDKCKDLEMPLFQTYDIGHLAVINSWPNPWVSWTIWDILDWICHFFAPNLDKKLKLVGKKLYMGFYVMLTNIDSVITQTSHRERVSFFNYFLLILLIIEAAFIMLQMLFIAFFM